MTWLVHVNTGSMWKQTWELDAVWPGFIVALAAHLTALLWTHKSAEHGVASCQYPDYLLRANNSPYWALKIVSFGKCTQNLFKCSLNKLRPKMKSERPYAQKCWFTVAEAVCVLVCVWHAHTFMHVRYISVHTACPNRLQKQSNSCRWEKMFDIL